MRRKYNNGHVRMIHLNYLKEMKRKERKEVTSGPIYQGGAKKQAKFFYSEKKGSKNLV